MIYVRTELIIGGRILNKLKYAGNTVLIGDIERKPQERLQKLLKKMRREEYVSIVRSHNTWFSANRSVQYAKCNWRHDSYASTKNWIIKERF